MFDFLNSIGGNLKNDIEEYLQGAQSMASGALSEFFPSKGQGFRPDASPKPMNVMPLLNKINSNNQQPQQQPVQPSQQPQNNQPIPQPQDFANGFAKFGSNVPVATASGAFSKAASMLPPTVDPYLPAIIALLETGGGANAVANNNAFNISGIQNGQQGYVSYPDYTTALLGGNNNGDQSQGFIGTLLNNPAYAPFLKSGNLADFFKVYTPPGAQYGNPDLPTMLNNYAQLRSLFGK